MSDGSVSIYCLKTNSSASLLVTVSCHMYILADLNVALCIPKL